MGFPCSGAAAAKELRVVSDPSEARTPDAGGRARKEQSDRTSGASLSRQAPKAVDSPADSSQEEEERTEFQDQRETEIKQLGPAAAQEERRMREVVQLLDREAAFQWLSGFISSQPFNCPVKERKEWTQAIMFAAERNGLPLSKEILGLVTCIISIESGFHADPPAVDASRGEDIAGLMARAEKELFEKMGTVMSVPPVPRLYQAYKEKYSRRLTACRTEGQVEIVAREIAAELKRDADCLPKFISAVISKEIDKLTHIVRTKGSMQLNYIRARQVMKERGEQFTDEELFDYMYTVNGGVDVGVAALKPMFLQYAAHYATPDSLSWLFFVGMDYHYGPFSSRNMMEQIRIRDLSGKKIAIDGDFLHYDDKGRPQLKDSDTLQAVKAILPSMPRSAVFRAFLLEKDCHYIYTDLHRSLAERHRERFGETPFAVVGELWMGENAKIKHGLMWKTKAYLNKLDRYLNSIPWDSNTAR